MDKQFKIAIYHNSRDYKFKNNPTIITDIITLLNFINKTVYYKFSNDSGTIANPNEDDWDYFFREIYENPNSIIAGVDILEYPKNNTYRIIGIDALYALPQKTNKVVFSSINDIELCSIPKESINAYPYTINEFLNLIANNHHNKDLFENFDFVQILNH